MMAKLSLSLVVLLLLGACTKQAPEQKAAAHKSSDVVENEMVVKGDKQAIESVLAKAGSSADLYALIPGQDIYQVRIHSKKWDMDQALAELNKTAGVEYAEPNFRVHLVSNLNLHEWPKDQMFFKQWALNNVGQSPPFGIPGERGADMDVMKVWQTVTKGSDQVVVAVIDTGVDYSHPDLKDNMWINEKESPLHGGLPGVDDDKNGYYDDVYGYDFTSMDRKALHYGQLGDPDPMDEDGHGTHCAGSIGATANNDRGITGLNWNVQIMALKGLSGAGGSSADLARAIYYAANKNVDIMSNSWGGGNESQLIKGAIAEAQKKGILFVAASGNDGKNNDVEKSYPAGYKTDHKNQPLENILSVGASDNQDNAADFSNYGHQSVHVFAPGVEIISTYPVAKTPEGRQPYAVMSGTSMATPYVSGIAALMLAADPSLKKRPDLMKQILIQSSDQKPGLLGKSESNGRVNAYKAVTMKASGQSAKPQWIEKSLSINQRGYTQELVDIQKEISIPEAKAIRVHFDFVQIQEPFDSLYIYDQNHRLISKVESTEDLDHWSAAIPGNKVYVRFVNSKVRQFTAGLQLTESSESSCLTKGALEVVQMGADKFSCSIDAPTSTGSGETIYNNFGSQGYSIDRVAYLLDDKAKKE